MRSAPELLDRAVPDRTDTRDLPPRLAAEVDHLAGRFERWTAVGTPVGVRARALVQAGELDGARDLLAGTTGWGTDVQDLAAGAWAASRVGPLSAIDALTPSVTALGDAFIEDGEVALGPAAMYRGLLRAGLGDLEGASAELVDAVAKGDHRAPIWGARARVELARVLWTRSTLGTPDAEAIATSAGRAQAAAATFFAASGHRHLGAECAAMTSDLVDGRARPLLGHLCAGERWRIGFGVVPWTDVEPSKGLVALRYLIANHGRVVPAVALDKIASGSPAGSLEELPTKLLEQLARGDGDSVAELRSILFDERIRSRTTKLIRRTINRLTEQHPVLGRHLDAHVRTGYACRYDGGDDVVWEL